jgi:hypothetical protein
MKISGLLHARTGRERHSNAETSVLQLWTTSRLYQVDISRQLFAHKYAYILNQTSLKLKEDPGQPKHTFMVSEAWGELMW